MGSTNFFFVRDVARFVSWVSQVGQIAVEGVGENAGKFQIRERELGPCFRFSRSSPDDFLSQLSIHLRKDSVVRVDTGRSVSLALPRGISWGV